MIAQNGYAVSLPLMDRHRIWFSTSSGARSTWLKSMLADRRASARSTGRTEQWEVTKKLFDFHARRLGFKQHETPAADLETVEAAAPVQASLF